MTTQIQMEDLEEKIETSSIEVEESTQQDPLKNELEKVQKEGKTELEKAAFSAKKIVERIKELGGDPDAILGRKETPQDLEDEDRPLTLRDLKKLEQDKASKTALQSAEEISNETERELVKFHLQNTIKSTGNPSKDLENARAIVNSVKNQQVAEEISRKSPAKTHSSSTSAPAKEQKDNVELTQDEITFMQTFGLSEEEVLKSRR